MTYRISDLLLAGVLLGAAMLIATPASAGIPECGGMRLEDAFECEIRGDVDCMGGCSELGIYKKACATQLHTVCREECTVDPEPSCTDACTEQCSSDCDQGVNVICIHNCFDECAGVCTATCEDAEDPETCMASCEATCDGECDVQCEATVSSSCYQHCVECCGGSCGAQANMTCQTDCQEEAFESCEYELRADCDASCDVDGALFCDGEFVLAGSEMDACLDVLLDHGVMEAEEAVQEAVDEFVDSVSYASPSCACSAGDDRGSGLLTGLFMFGLAGLLRRRRR